MRRALLFAFAAMSPACTTIHAAGGGAAPGEFYVAAQKSYLIFPGPSYILRCEEIRDPMGVELTCTRMLTGAEAGQVAPGTADTQTFVRKSK